MIKKLDIIKDSENCIDASGITRNVASSKVIDSINEIVDFLDKQINDNNNVLLKSMRMEKEFAEDECQRLKKALDYAINVIKTVAKMSDKLSKEYGDTIIEQLDNIQAYCWQEGYVLTHKEELYKILNKGGNNE